MDDRSISLLIVDDHPVVRAGLAALLRGHAGAGTVLEAADAGAGLALARAHTDLDVVLLDLMLPDGKGGTSAVESFVRLRPDLPVIVLSAIEDPALVRGALAAGALGYIPKSADTQTLLAALRFVMGGNLYVPPAMLVDGGVAAPKTHGLSERQVEVLRLLAAGLPNKAIGRQLGVSEKTVKAHVSAIFRGLNVANRVQAVAAARRWRLV